MLFDDNRLAEETARVQRQLAEMQLPDGSWPWFPGGRGNDYITLYIATGFGRMRHLGVDIGADLAVKALARLDAWIDGIYRDILQHGKKQEDHLSPTIALYLYGRSFFLDDRPIEGQAKEAVNYFLGQAKTYWLKLANRQSQAHLAVALKRFGDRQTPQAIMRSIKERSVSEEEMGMFWRELELSWWWYRAPIETQAMMIEAFDEVANDAKAVEDCKVWLLKQKQTQDWKTTKATADSVYALLLRGANLLASDALVEVSLGGQAIKPERVEAGTGYYEHRFVGPEIKPEFGQVTVKKVDEGVAWGSRSLAVPGGHEQGQGLRGNAAHAEEDALCQAAFGEGAGARTGPRPAAGRRRVGREDRAARRPRHGVRPHEGPAGQRDRAGERALAIQVSRRVGLLRVHSRHGQPFLH